MTSESGSRVERGASQCSARYELLDSWRGIAALGVVLGHIGVNVGLDLGVICVMMFFVISGYCIAASTAQALDRGLTFETFMHRRIRRIYPPYLCSILFFVFTRVVKDVVGGGGQLSSDWIVWLQNLTLTQWLSLTISPRGAPYENPALFVAGYWSLNYEEQFYFVMAVILLLYRIVPVRFPNLAFLIFLLAYVANIASPDKFYGIFIEMWIPFFFGIVTYLRISGMFSKNWLIVDACIVIFAIHAYILSQIYMAYIYSDWFAASMFALLLIKTHRFDSMLASTKVVRAVSMLGLISYSLYLTHQFNLNLSLHFANIFTSHGAPDVVVPFVRVGFLCGVALVFWWFCERPFLSRRRGATSAAGAPN